MHVSDCNEDVEDDEDDWDVVSERNWGESRGKGALFVPARQQIGPFLKFCRKSLNCYIAWCCWAVSMFTQTQSSKGKYHTVQCSVLGVVLQFCQIRQKWTREDEISNRRAQRPVTQIRGGQLDVSDVCWVPNMIRQNRPLLLLYVQVSCRRPSTAAQLPNSHKELCSINAGH